jgi:hypothetical protein
MGAVVVQKSPGTSSIAHGMAFMNQVAQKGNRLMPWYIGLAIVLVTVIFVGYRM